MAYFVGHCNVGPEAIRIADGSVLDIADIEKDPHTSPRGCRLPLARGAKRSLGTDRPSGTGHRRDRRDPS